ncbi:MAG TPA: hypothetical protein VFX92_09510 [Candidatus Krumholzibacteria bacterium]|nr:hypothetical protein [Candidatus Krumholzibacteria bacterium]
MQRYLAAVLMSLFLVSCGGDSTTDPGDGGGGPKTTKPVPTAAGTPDGAPVTQTIGAGGGSMTSSDGFMQLDVPAGALGADTDITIQPITNTAWGGTGKGYRLTPAGLTFTAPVALTFQLDDAALAGTNANFMDVAVQRDDGVWGILKHRTLDENAGTLTCTTPHFSDYSLIDGVQIRPGAAVVDEGQSIYLEVQFCARETIDDGEDVLAALVTTCDNELAPLGTFRNWSVNGAVGGNATVGRVSPTSGLRIGYTAPAVAPNPNVVAVSVETTYDGMDALLVANITITGVEEWTGNSSLLSDDGEKFEATITWTQWQSYGTLKIFRPSGSVTYTLAPDPDCTLLSYTPNTAIISPDDGTLYIDYGTDPPTFFGAGATSWEVEHCFQCLTDPSDCVTGTTGAGWFGNEGELAENGTSIEAIIEDGSRTYVFHFIKSTP